MEMIEGRVQPNHLTPTSIQKAHANICDGVLGKQIHGCVEEYGVASINFVAKHSISLMK